MWFEFEEQGADYDQGEEIDSEGTHERVIFWRIIELGQFVFDVLVDDLEYKSEFEIEAVIVVKIEIYSVQVFWQRNNYWILIC